MRGNRMDGNQAEIVRALRKVGAMVTIIEQPLDLLVSFRGTHYILEVKTAIGKLNKKQEDFINSCPAPIHVVRSVEDALSAINALPRILY